MQVAQTILQQLGGNHFAQMTGAKNFVGSPNSIQFQIGRNAKGVNKVAVTLEPSDTYRVDFYHVRAGKVTVLAQAIDVYADQLRAVFTQHTGLYTSLKG